MKNPVKSKRMRIRLKMGISVLLCMLIYPTLIDAAPDDLRYLAPILPTSSGAAVGSYGFLELSDEVLGQARENIPDVRLYAEDEEIPYTLVSSTSSDEEKKSVRVEMFNQGRDSEGNQIVEVKIPENQWANGLVLVTADKNFVRKVLVEGSNDQKQWLTIQPESIVFDLTKEQKSRNTGVTFSKTNLRFLRVSVINEGESPLQLEGIDLQLLSSMENVGESKERSSELRTSIDKEGVQEILLELKSPNLPIEELEVITQDKNFTRKIELYGSQTGERWNFITRGELYDYQLDKAAAVNRKLKFKGNSRFYKLKIYNLDNRPLEILKVKLRGDNPLLVFPVTEAESLTLNWGNAELRAPSYDLEKLLPNLDFAKMGRYTMSQGEENPNYKTTDSRPWTERHSGLLNVVLVLAVLALLGIIAKSLKKVNFKE